jgi:hypothetical protein
LLVAAIRSVDRLVVFTGGVIEGQQNSAAFSGSIRAEQALADAEQAASAGDLSASDEEEGAGDP